MLQISQYDCKQNEYGCGATIVKNNIMLKYSLRLENANYMQISNMIHILIWHAEWWLGEWV